MEIQGGVWYIGFLCKHCNRLQAVMPDPTMGAPGTGKGGPLKTKCEDCHGYGEYQLRRFRIGDQPLDPPVWL